MGEGEHNGSYAMDDGSDTQPFWFVTLPTKVTDRNKTDNNCDVKCASNEACHRTGELVATFNG